ncbi:MAG TPA: type I 3-dehydroquinate dehydratase [Acidobacteriota bacterium]|nr:type I 3-dehydroquinate dehydratase [Acidobacteriota bacterium]
MICVSLKENNTDLCLKALQKLSFAEIRMDKMSLSKNDIYKIFSSHPKLIATCRPGSHSDLKRKNLLIQAIEAGAAFVDMEIETEEYLVREVMEKARKHNCKVILSFHDFSGTPPLKSLIKLRNKCFSRGADIAKIACYVQTPHENSRLLGLLQEKRPLIVIGMGKLGKITRIASLFCGSPFIYASLETGKETAEGQLHKKTLENIFRIINHE